MEVYLHNRFDPGVRKMPWTNDSITADAERVLLNAAPEARSLGLEYVGTEAVLLSMVRLGTPELLDALERVGSTRNQLEVAIRDSAAVRIGARAEAPLLLAARTMRAVEYAGQSARERQSAQISNRDLLVGLVMERNGLAHSILADRGIDVATVLAD